MSTQSSPGLNAPCAYDKPAGVPPNMTTLAAQSAGIVPGNMQITNTLTSGNGPRALLETQAAGGTQGTYTNPGGGGLDTMNIAMSGGSGLGAASNDVGGKAGISSQVAGSMPASAISTANPPQFQG
jgi:hypothetical protein